MCGVCGIVGPAAVEGVARMIKAMHHRGPDDWGIFEEEGIALGHTRLAIIDTSAGGHQPMSNAEQSVWITYNGEAYNYREERERLRRQGYLFSTESDTEVVLHLYEEYGLNFAMHVRGMFALAIYDRRLLQPRLLLVRDHFGIKPLLFARLGSSLAFASELKGLIASGLVERRIDPVSLRLLLTHGSVPQPRSIIPGVEMLLPGHLLVYEEGEINIHPYTHLQRNRMASMRTQPYPEQVRMLRNALEETVASQMVSDVPIGAFLSGGIDSAITAALMARHGASRLKTFSVGFGSEGTDLDETDDALRVAQFIGSDHTRVVVTGHEVRDRLDHMAYALDQPSIDGINAYLVSMAARELVTVAVSGTGGDELFAGYPWYAEMARFDALKSRGGIRVEVQAFVGSVARHKWLDRTVSSPIGKIVDRLRTLGAFLPHYRRQYQIFGPSGAAAVLSSDWEYNSRGAPTPETVMACGDELAGGSAVDRVTALCLRGYTQNQLLRDIDAVSMSHSLEVRVPFLDPTLSRQKRARDIS
ncbi:MAG: asparagine synthase (glutamine-hydrolyzing) [Nitrospirae bacterium]|nr:MAG: asparagine synthase (glutamine-hydrolyzing) [Nitrospirota bacterium]